MQVILPSNHWLYQNTNFGCAYKIYTPCSSFVAYILLFALLWFKCLQCIIVFITLKAVKPISKKVISFLIFTFSPKRNVLSFFYQSMSCLLAISLKPKTNLILWNFAQTLWYFFEIIFQEYFLFFNWNPPNYFILSSYNRRVTVTKVTQKALNCQCLGKAKMSKTCYHAWALSESVAFCA